LTGKYNFFTNNQTEKKIKNDFAKNTFPKKNVNYIDINGVQQIIAIFPWFCSFLIPALNWYLSVSEA